MCKNLVIVESPAKAKTLEKFLGEGFVVKSSFGHIRDLVKKDLGIDIENNFEPTYEVAADKKKVVAELTKFTKKAENVWLASDEDREGEAIAWHLTQVLKLPVESTKRIVFHEITKKAILEAVENPRTVDMNLVNAQQARRILDRLVGFELSPLLWRKVRPSLSAGRVQSVAVRLLVEREREIIEFQPKAYFRVIAQFFSEQEPKKIVFKAELSRRFDEQKEAEEFLQKCIDATFTVSANERKPGTKNPPAPFTTSSLQQEASLKLGLSVAQTMSVAQRLYEGGWITYMRTDSMNLSGEAIAAAKKEITSQFGEEYSQIRAFKTKAKGAQEAHEAIRPSYMERSKVEGSAIEKRLYELIWKRTMASQMASAKIERTVITVDVGGTKEQFKATGEIVVFDGFLRLYSEVADEDTSPTSDQSESQLPDVKQGDSLSAKDIVATERFTQSPPRYSEASLVKKLEELGIGRPSTYAPTISTIINRGYVLKHSRDGVAREYVVLKLEKGNIERKKESETVGRETNRLSPTDIGILVTDYLESQFKDIMDYNFTATVEREFDLIADGEEQWIEMIRRFYTPFHASVEAAHETTSPEQINKARVLGVDPKTGRQVSARIGRYGPMVELEVEPSDEAVLEEDKAKKATAKDKSKAEEDQGAKKAETKGKSKAKSKAKVGDEAEGEKPRYASLREGQLISSITLEQALELLSLPRTVGEVDGEELVVSIGKFGPYVRYQGKFTSLGKEDDPYTIDKKRAIELIEEKKLKDAVARTPLVVFEQEPEMLVLKGRYGPYISYEGKNYPIPKSKEPETLTLEQAREIIEKRKSKKK